MHYTILPHVRRPGNSCLKSFTWSVQHDCFLLLWHVLIKVNSSGTDNLVRIRDVLHMLQAQRTHHTLVAALCLTFTARLSTRLCRR